MLLEWITISTSGM